MLKGLPDFARFPQPSTCTRLGCTTYIIECPNTTGTTTKSLYPSLYFVMRQSPAIRALYIPEKKYVGASFSPGLTFPWCAY